jgi:hypothetical protein
MGEMGDRDRPMFLPPEEPPAEAPTTAAAAPAGDAFAPPVREGRVRAAPPQRTGPPGRPAAPARVVALVTGGMLVTGAALVWANGFAGDAGPAEPPGFARLTDVCTMVPAASVQPLELESIGRPYAPPGGGTLRAEAYAACGWTTGRSIWRDTGPHHQRRLHASVRVLLPRADMTGHTAARLQYAAVLAGAREMAAKRVRLDAGTTEYWPVVPLRGVGDAAYRQYEVNRSGVSTVGLGRAVVRLRNAVITVEYSGSDYPADRRGFADRSKAGPLAGENAQQGAAAVAVELTRALAACVTCVN